ncbi:uncharacterized protein LOC120610993 [Pteropus medius]|uniref:uncharacterized protein LOC120610993 n=1 Tax=Pteropus vampyrus TaxID=132908 RepID=UPI00196A3A74|nr:uncharacterized protein LOC120610993 [Pteropus giganteus]
MVDFELPVGHRPAHETADLTALANRSSPLCNGVLIYKTGDSADVQLSSQQNRELGPSLLRPVWGASDFRERQMGSLAGSPHSSPPRRTRLPCSRPCRTKGQAAVEARECESGGWPLDKGQFRGPGEVGSDRSWQLQGQSVSCPWMGASFSCEHLACRRFCVGDRKQPVVQCTQPQGCVLTLHAPPAPRTPAALESVVGTQLGGSRSRDRGAPSPLSSADVCRAPATGKPRSGPSGHSGAVAAACCGVRVCTCVLACHTEELGRNGEQTTKEYAGSSDGFFCHTCRRPSFDPKPPLAPTSL